MTSIERNEASREEERETITLVVAGQIHCGKSSLCGQILKLTNQIDEHTMRKHTEDAVKSNHQGSALANIMNTNEEERAAARTVDLGRAQFDTAHKHCILLDAPGHRDYIPNMIQGASMADVAVLVVSARTGEFEAGIDSGLTKEHAMLAKTLGVQQLIVMISKMDDLSVGWGKARYDEVYNKIVPLIKSVGFDPKLVPIFPASPLKGENIKDPVIPEVCPWLEPAKSFFQILDDLPPIARDSKAPLRMSIRVNYKEMGSVYVQGKIESGTLTRNTKTLMMMPTKQEVQLVGIQLDEQEVEMAACGTQPLLKLKGIEEEMIQEGYVLSSVDQPCRRSMMLEVRLKVTDLPQDAPIMSIGYTAVLHLHAATSDCTLVSIVQGIDPKTGTPKAVKPRFLKIGDVAAVRLSLPQSIACESYKDNKALGRFTIRSAGTSIAIGTILRMKDA